MEKTTIKKLDFENEENWDKILKDGRRCRVTFENGEVREGELYMEVYDWSVGAVGYWLDYKCLFDLEDVASVEVLDWTDEDEIKYAEV